MSFAGMLVHDVTIIAPGAMVDRYGDTIANWNSPTTTATKAWIYQRTSEEDIAGGRDAQIQNWRAFLPADVDVSAGNRISWPLRNLVFEVDGPPRASYRPATGPDLHHLEVDLRHVAG
jgi:head-tail adaptor